MKPYYQRAGLTIYHGDCGDILPTIASCDLVLTDPPYEAEAHTLQRRIKPGGGSVEEPIHFGPMSEELRKLTARELARISGRWILTFCQIEAAHVWRSCYEAAGLRYMRTCLWVKPDPQPQLTGDRPGMGYETILAMHQAGRTRWNGRGRHGVFTHLKNDHSGLKNEHPTQKPESLIRELVALFSDEGGLVLDPYMGSGTTLRAAKDLGRRAIGIEREEKYCEIAAKRLSQEVLEFA